MEIKLDWKELLVIKVAPAPLRELENDVDRDALSFLRTEKLDNAFGDDAITLEELEKIWTEESRAAAAAARAAASKAKNAGEHVEGSHYVTGGRPGGQQDFVSYLNAKVGVAEAKAAAYENKASAMKGKEKRQYTHIASSYKATAGKIAVSRATWMGVKRMGDVGVD